MRNAFYLLIILLCFCPITFAQEQQPPQQQQPPPQQPQQPPPQQQQIAVPEQPGVTEAAVQEQLEEHHFRLGIFRLQPHFGFNSGYDSNALYTQNEVIGDYFLSAVPAIRVGLKLGQHAFLDIGDEIEFLYYKKLSQRRDIFNSTNALFLTGTDRLLLTLDGAYERRKAPFNNEIDIPVDHKTQGGSFHVKYLLTQKVSLSPSVTVSQTEFLGADNTFFLQNRRSVVTHFSGNYNFRPEFSIALAVFQGHVQSLTTDTTRNFVGIWGGIDSNANRFKGYIHVGYGTTHLGSELVHPILFEGEGNFQLGRRLTISGYGERNFEASAFAQASVRLTSFVGTKVTIPLSARFTLYPSYTFGNNNYGTTIIEGDQVRIDRFQTGELSLGFRLIDRFSLRGGLEYLKRQSSISGFSKNRFAYLAGITYSVD